jgi:hypothetical protein
VVRRKVMLDPEKVEFFTKVIGSVALAKPMVSSLASR